MPTQQFNVAEYVGVRKRVALSQHLESGMTGERREYPAEEASVVIATQLAFHDDMKTLQATSTISSTF